MSAGRGGHRGKTTGKDGPAVRALPWLSLALRLVLGALLVYASLPKLLHPDQFADVIINYRILTGVLVSWLALALPWLELITGVCLLLGVVTRAAAILSSAMFATFSAALLSAQLRHLDIACGCFDVAASSGKTGRSLLEAGLLLLASIALVVLADRSSRYSLSSIVRVPAGRRRLVTGVMLAALAALLLGVILVQASRGPSDDEAAAGGMPTPTATAGGGGTTVAPSPNTSLKPATLWVLAGRELTASQQVAAVSQALPGLSLNVSQAVAAQSILDLLAGGSQPDVIECRFDQLPWLVEQGHVEPVDTSRLASWSDVSEEFLGFPGLTVDGKTYAAPVDATVTGLIYRTDRVATAPTSYRDLFAKQFKDKSAIENDAASAIRLGAAVSGWGDTADPSDAQLAAAMQVLKTDWPHFKAYYSDQTELEQLFESGDVVIATGTADTARRLLEKNVPVAFVAPREGVLVRARALAIGAHRKEPAAAYALLEHYLSLPTQQLDAQLFGNVPSRSDVPGAPTLTDATGGARPILVTPPTDMAEWQKLWGTVTAEPPPGGS